MKFANKTAEYFYKISYLSFLLGMPNFWIEELQLPKKFVKDYAYFSRLCDMAIYVLIPFELGAFITQHDLTHKQETDRWIYSISHPILLAYAVIISRHEKDIKDLIVHVLRLKEVFNDPKIEDQMVRKSTLTSLALVLSCVASMSLHSISACLQVIKSEGTFTTLITVWPPVNERSYGADSARIITNILWWLLVNRVYGSYIFVISLTTNISFQFINLQRYFYSLNKIFENKNLKQRQKERKYEQALKTGIQLHSDTLDCVKRTKNICGGVYSAQIVFVLIMLVFLLSQMLRSERTMVNAFATAVTTTAVLMSTGLFLWNAGDITVEASNLKSAMYSSGWHNCRSNSKHVRLLLVIAMSRAQKPVVIKGLGIMELSYQSYLSLVKTSYSVFSVLY